MPVNTRFQSALNTLCTKAPTGDNFQKLLDFLENKDASIEVGKGSNAETPKENATAQSEKTSFTEINLLEIGRKKLPKRLVYFSDGVLEEYSSDEEEMDGVNSDTQPLIDTKTLPWVPYFGYLIWWLGSRTLAVCDYLGENLAWFLGITSPKFQYELDQYKKMAEEEEELENYFKSENAGWCLTNCNEKPEGTIESQPRVNAIDVQLNGTNARNKVGSSV